MQLASDKKYGRGIGSGNQLKAYLESCQEEASDESSPKPKEYNSHDLIRSLFYLVLGKADVLLRILILGAIHDYTVISFHFAAHEIKRYVRRAQLDRNKAHWNTFLRISLLFGQYFCFLAFSYSHNWWLRYLLCVPLLKRLSWSLIIIVVLIPAASGYFTSILLNWLVCSVHRTERSAQLVVGFIKKVQLSALGKQLTLPLPPISKLEEVSRSYNGRSAIVCSKAREEIWRALTVALCDIREVEALITACLNTETDRYNVSNGEHNDCGHNDGDVLDTGVPGGTNSKKTRTATTVHIKRNTWEEAAPHTPPSSTELTALSAELFDSALPRCISLFLGTYYRLGTNPKETSIKFVILATLPAHFSTLVSILTELHQHLCMICHELADHQHHDSLSLLPMGVTERKDHQKEGSCTYEDEEDSFASLTTTAAAAAADNVVASQYITSRQTLHKLRLRLEGLANRLWLCESELCEVDATRLLLPTTVVGSLRSQEEQEEAIQASEDTRGESLSEDAEWTTLPAPRRGSSVGSCSSFQRKEYQQQQQRQQQQQQHSDRQAAKRIWTAVARLHGIVIDDSSPVAAPAASVTTAAATAAAASAALPFAAAATTRSAVPAVSASAQHPTDMDIPRWVLTLRNQSHCDEELLSVLQDLPTFEECKALERNLRTLASGLETNGGRRELSFSAAGAAPPTSIPGAYEFDDSLSGEMLRGGEAVGTVNVVANLAPRNEIDLFESGDEVHMKLTGGEETRKCDKDESHRGRRRTVDVFTATVPQRGENEKNATTLSYAERKRAAIEAENTVEAVEKQRQIMSARRLLAELHEHITMLESDVVENVRNLDENNDDSTNGAVEDTGLSDDAVVVSRTNNEDHTLDGGSSAGDDNHTGRHASLTSTVSSLAPVESSASTIGAHASSHILTRVNTASNAALEGHNLHLDDLDDEDDIVLLGSDMTRYHAECDVFASSSSPSSPSRVRTALQNAVESVVVISSPLRPIAAAVRAGLNSELLNALRGRGTVTRSVGNGSEGEEEVEEELFCGFSGEEEEEGEEDGFEGGSWEDDCDGDRDDGVILG